MRDIDNKNMIHKTARALLELMDRKSTHMERSAIAIDPAGYLDPELFEREKRLLFRQMPVVVALSADLPNAGDWQQHEDTGVPILVVRNKEGKLKAFLNACRHRGAKLTSEPCGNQKRFTCPFHAWTFDTDGKLIGFPAQSLFGDVDRADLSLVELPCEERAGLVFVQAQPGATFDLDVILQGGLADLEGWHLDRNKLIGERDLVTKSNWKLALDTYCENYHFQSLHAKDFGPYKVPNCAHHWQWGDRNRNWTLAWPSNSLETMRDVPEEQWGDIHAHFSMLHFIFPNTVIAMYPDTCNVMQVYPGENVGEQLSRMRFYSRTPNPTKEQEDIIMGRFETFYHVLQNEDYLMVRTAFKNIATGIMPPLLFGRNEPALTWLHEALEDATRGNAPSQLTPVESKDRAVA